MSRFRVEMDLAFSQESDAIAFINMIEKIKSKFYAGDVGDIISAGKSLRYHECFHDDQPPTPCGDYVYVEIDDPTVNNHRAKDGKSYKIADFNAVEDEQ